MCRCRESDFKSSKQTAVSVTHRGASVAGRVKSLKSCINMKWDSEKDSKWTSKDSLSGFTAHLYPFLFSVVCLCVSFCFRLFKTLFMFFKSLHVIINLPYCLPHKFSPKYSMQYLNYSLSLCHCLPVYLFPSLLPLSNSWHTILPAEWFIEGVLKCMCVCISICDGTYICYHICVCSHAGIVLG